MPCAITVPVHSKYYFTGSVPLTEFLLIPASQKAVGWKLLAITYLKLSW